MSYHPILFNLSPPPGEIRSIIRWSDPFPSPLGGTGKNLTHAHTAWCREITANFTLFALQYSSRSIIAYDGSPFKEWDEEKYREQIEKLMVMVRTCSDRRQQQVDFDDSMMSACRVGTVGVWQHSTSWNFELTAPPPWKCTENKLPCVLNYSPMTDAQLFPHDGCLIIPPWWVRRGKKRLITNW